MTLILGRQKSRIGRGGMFFLRASSIACLILLGGAALAAPAPATFAQQGRLLHTDGSPVTGSISMTFAIYDAAAATTSIWNETQTVTLDANGYFAVQLGSMTSLGSSAALTAALGAGTTIYLGTT